MRIPSPKLLRPGQNPIKPLKLPTARVRSAVKMPNPNRSLLQKATRIPKIAKAPRLRLNNNA